MNMIAQSLDEKKGEREGENKRETPATFVIQ